MHAAERFVVGEADALLLEAARIQHALRTMDEDLAAMTCSQRAAQHIVPLLQEEAATIQAVLMEHAGPSADCPARAEAASLQRILADTDRLAHAVADHRSCGAVLRTYMDDLDAHAKLERQQVLPFLHALGPDMLREAGARIRHYHDAPNMEGFELPYT